MWIDLYYDMLQQCTSPEHRMYKVIGRRGIQVCEEWSTDRDAFVSWAEANTCEMQPEEIPLILIDKMATEFSPDTCHIIAQGAELPTELPNKPVTVYNEDALVATITDEDYIERQVICNACSFLRNDRCMKFCSCSGDKHESRQKDVKCPVGKW